MKKFVKTLVSLAAVSGLAIGMNAALASDQGNWTGSFKMQNGAVVTHTPQAVFINETVVDTPVSPLAFIGLLGLLNPISPLCQALGLNQSRDEFILALSCVNGGNQIMPINPPPNNEK